jgi:hypothetical protein
VPFVIREWSKKREDEALSRCLVSFLPVNFQPFSIAKSLNRGLSALVGGTQLLTAGFPLYESLAEYVYDDAASLIDDLENSKLKLCSEKLGEFAEWVGERAAPAAEAQNLAKFFASKTKSSPKEADDERHCAVLHGAKSTASINSFTQRLGCLSLASPLLPGGMRCDAHIGFFGNEPSLKLRVSEAALNHLPAELRVAAVWADPSLGKGPSWEVPLDQLESDFPFESIRHPKLRSACAEAATNDETMKLTRMFFRALFPNFCIIESELDPVRNNIRAVERA